MFRRFQYLSLKAAETLGARATVKALGNRSSRGGWVLKAQPHLVNKNDIHTLLLED